MDRKRSMAKYLVTCLFLLVKIKCSTWETITFMKIAINYTLVPFVSKLFV